MVSDWREGEGRLTCRMINARVRLGWVRKITFIGIEVTKVVKLYICQCHIMVLCPESHLYREESWTGSMIVGGIRGARGGEMTGVELGNIQ